ncbi:MAG: hypothetical protein Q7T68_14340 [Sphingopyxis sp.]|nr:hypothetical protein [Sphingopyxis sp.]
MKTGWVGIVAALAACSSPAGETAAAPNDSPARAAASAKPADVPAPATTKPVATLAPNGLLVADKLIPFGIPRASAELAITRVQGAQLDKGSSTECSAGTIDYTSYNDDLQLTFQDGQFVGWAINAAESPLRTAKGIGVGSPRQSLDAAYSDVMIEDSSLGLLFSAGDLVGILDQDGIEGIITGIWAGTVCLID